MRRWIVSILVAVGFLGVVLAAPEKLPSKPNEYILDMYGISAEDYELVWNKAGELNPTTPVYAVFVRDFSGWKNQLPSHWKLRNDSVFIFIVTSEKKAYYKIGNKAPVTEEQLDACMLSHFQNEEWGEGLLAGLNCI